MSGPPAAGSWAPEARSCCSLSAPGPGSPAVQKRLHLPSEDAGVARLGLLQRLRYAAKTGDALAQERLHLGPGVPVLRALGADHPVPLRVKEVGLVRELQDGAPP